MADNPPNVIGGDFDPFTAPPSPAAAALNGGGAGADDDRKARAEFYRAQTSELERLGKKEEELYEKKFAEEEPLRREMMAGQVEQTRIGNAALERFLKGQQDIPAPPQFNAPAAQQDALAWMSVAAGFGAIAGSLSRYHTTTALNAFSGMVNGFAKGQVQAFDMNYKTWQANADKAIEYNARAGREYKAIMDNAKLNIDAKSNLMQMTADKWQDQIMANAARIRDVGRMTQLMEGQQRFEENFKIRKEAFEEHKKILDLNYDYKIRQMYGTEGDVEGAAQQILSLQTPMPSQQAQAKYPYLRKAAELVTKRNPSYKASDFTADQAMKRMAATGDIMAMRQALGKMIGMQSAIATFEPLADYNGNVILSLVDKVDQSGTQTVFEAWLRAGRKATDDPDVQQFDQAVQTLKTESARILQNPNLTGQLTDTARGEMGSILPENITPANARRAIPFLQQEMKYRRGLIDSQVEYLNGSIQSRAEGKPAPTYTPPEPPPVLPPAPTIIQSGGGEYTIEPQ